MPDALNSTKRKTLITLAIVSLLIVMAGIALYGDRINHPTGNSPSATPPLPQTLSEKEIADVLKYGKPVMQAMPSDNMRPDGYDSQVFDVNGARYVIYTGGLSGHHRYGTRLPKNK
jgi:hypothetical protein